MNAFTPENVCKICNKEFSRKADCNRHRRLHYGIKPYACEAPGCGKRFAQYTALKTHRNVHTGLKPFKCGVAGCKSTFGDPSSCARHRREIHRPGKPFKCPVPGCTSSILRSSSFKIHLKNTTWILTNMGSPSATLPLNSFYNRQNPRGSRKGKSPTLVIRLAIKPCPSSVHSTRGIHSSHFQWMLSILYSCSPGSPLDFPATLRCSWPRPPRSHRTTTLVISYRLYERPR